MLPNFIIVGAGKCGTTALNHYLEQHPDVYMSPVKEPNFFALEGETFPTAEEDPLQQFNFPTAVTERSAYEGLFEGVQGEKAIGEVSPLYLYSDRAAYKIKKHLPDVKIIVMLRDPVERLYSRYMHLARENRQPSDTFEDALSGNRIWWERNDLISEGFYSRHWARYQELFAAEQLKVCFYEDFVSRPNETLADIFEFLGVDTAFRPDMATKHNKSGFVKNPILDRLVGQQSIVKSSITRMLPGAWKWIRQNDTIRDLVTKVRNKNLHKPKLEKTTRRQMIQQVYREDILHLQNLLGKDLTHWLTT